MPVFLLCENVSPKHIGVHIRVTPMSSKVDRSDWEARESKMKKGFILTLAPLLSVFGLLTLSRLFPRPNPWPIKGFIGIVLVSGFSLGS
jgi:hypothetical protein